MLSSRNQLEEKESANSTANLVLDGEVDEVGVHNHPIRWPERRVVAEEKSRRDLRPAHHKPKRHNQPKLAYETQTQNQNEDRHSHIPAELLLLRVLLVGVQHILLVPGTHTDKLGFWVAKTELQRSGCGGGRWLPYLLTVFLVIIFFTTANLGPLLFDLPISTQTLTTAGTSLSSLHPAAAPPSETSRGRRARKGLRLCASARKKGG
jgi:hypothetical protein